MSFYSNDLTWEAWSLALSTNANSLISDIIGAKGWYDKWYTLTYGLSDIQIQALPQFSGRSIADITAMRFAWGVFLDLYNALYNLASLPQFNRESYLVPFVS